MGSRSGEAGQRGDDVRSDLWVRLEVRKDGGHVIELQSKVEAYYGDATRRQVAALLSALEVPHARVAIEDKGALPFMIAARIEAAARRAGIDGGDGRAERTAPIRGPSARDRLRRSRLYLPGNEPKYLVNAGLYRPDGVILDLEDSVHAQEKDVARILVRNALRHVDFKDAERMVRINPLPAGLLDLEMIVPEAPDLILVPKVENPDEIRQVDQAIGRLQGDAPRPLWLMPIIETARGIEQAFAIAAASERVAALTIGLEDYAADLGVPRSVDGGESLAARGRIVNAAKAADVQAIDSVYGQVDDLEGLETWAAKSHALGFEGMGCLHPRQIEIIHRGYSPTGAQIERALRIVAALDDAQQRGLGVVSLGSKMIDPPVVLQAQRLVQRARKLGLIEDSTDG